MKYSRSSGFAGLFLGILLLLFAFGAESGPRALGATNSVPAILAVAAPIVPACNPADVAANPQPIGGNRVRDVAPGASDFTSHIAIPAYTANEPRFRAVDGWRTRRPDAGSRYGPNLARFEFLRGSCST